MRDCSYCARNRALASKFCNRCGAQFPAQPGKLSWLLANSNKISILFALGFLLTACIWFVGMAVLPQLFQWVLAVWGAIGMAIMVLAIGVGVLTPGLTAVLRHRPNAYGILALNVLVIVLGISAGVFHSSLLGALSGIAAVILIPVLRRTSRTIIREELAREQETGTQSFSSMRRKPGY
ncbi:MAG: hypothetical protein ACRD3W_19870 [Terriglobales bacterium]